MFKKSVLLCSFLVAQVFCVDITNLHWDSSCCPDLRLKIKPYLFNEDIGTSALFETGRQNVRVNGTLGLKLENCMAKLSGEYLSQKLGFSFCSGRQHEWVQQEAIGANCILPIEIGEKSYFTEFSARYSHASGKHLSGRIIPRENGICHIRIGGSNAFNLSVGTFISFFDSTVVSGAIAYDYVKFNQKYQRDKLVQGLGLNLCIDQCFFDYFNIHLGLDLQAPYIACDARISSQFWLGNMPFELGIYGQRVNGQKSIPNSSRIGIEIGLDFDKICLKKCADAPVSCFKGWLSKSAVYMPTVLVMRDTKRKEFGKAPFVINEIGTVIAPIGFFDLDISQFFGGTGPLVFNASGLPPGLTLNPATGRIVGTIDGSMTGTVAITVRATNYFGSAQLNSTIQF